MEELKQTIIEAVVEGHKRAYELGYCGNTETQSVNCENPNELLTVEQVHKEFDIGINMVRKIFQDKELPVQRYTVPFKVTRKAMNKYINTHHDYLSERK